MRHPKVLFVLTSHSTMGNTGKPTGWYLSEAAHPWKVLRDGGAEIDFMSPRGGDRLCPLGPLVDYFGC